MSNTDHSELARADSQASWSFLGILFPLLGWILGTLSKSTLRRIVASPVTEQEVRRIRSKANMGIAVSTAVFAISLSFGVLIYQKSQEYAEQLRAEASQREFQDYLNEQKAREREAQQEAARKNALALCLDQAQKDYEKSWRAESASLGIADGGLPEWNANRQDARLREMRAECYLQ